MMKKGEMNKGMFSAFWLARNAVFGLFIILLFSFILSLIFPEGAQWLHFLGRFHPVLLHLPIGAFSGYLLLLLVNVFIRKEPTAASSDLLLALSATTAVISAIMGFFLATEGGFNEELLFRHKLSGAVFTLLLLAALFQRLEKALSLRVEYTVTHYVLVVAAFITMTITGHLGGSLTHGSDYLTRHLRPSSTSGAVAEKDLSDFQRVMQVFEAKCYQCHGPEKQKAKYRMDVMETLFAGGNSEIPAIIPGDAESSYLVELIQLPRDDDEAMPPEGKEQLTEEDIQLIVKWIDDGAIVDQQEAEALAAIQRAKQAVTIQEADESVKAVAEAVPAGLQVEEFSSGVLAGSEFSFQDQVGPLFQNYCFDCHDSDVQKGKFRMDHLNPDMVAGHDGDMWKHALDMINSGEMPEEDSPQPTTEERAMMVSWLTDELAKARELKKGKVTSTLRRLNKTQYNNTLQDLLGMDVNFARNLPDDEMSEEGFRNNGQTLTTSTLLLEYYIKIAREALDKAIATEAPPEIHRFKVSLGKKANPDMKGKQGLGYKSVPLSYSEYLPEVLSPRQQGSQWKGYSYRLKYPFEKKGLPEDSLYRAFYVDLRGSSKSHFSVQDEGVLMKASRPHVEKADRLWHGPSPNLKLVLREFPQQGQFVMKVEASRPAKVMMQQQFVPYDNKPVMASYYEDMEAQAGSGSIIIDALQPFESDNLASHSGYVREKKTNVNTRALYKFDVESNREGLYQLDVVMATKQKFPLTLEVNSEKLQKVLNHDTGSDSKFKSYSVGLIKLSSGENSIQINRDGEIPAIKSFTLTLLSKAKGKEAAAKKAEKLYASKKIMVESPEDERPYVRAYAGSRTDDGMEYRVFGDPKPVTGKAGERQVLEFRGRLENLPLPVIDPKDKGDLANMAVFGLWNDTFAKDAEDLRNPVTIHSIEMEGPYFDSWPTAAHRNIFIDSKNKKKPDVYAREVLSAFMERAYRRVPAAEEVDHVLKLYQQSRAEQMSFEESIKEALVFVLCSPHFLFIVEDSKPGEALDDFELASRLSYFLWDSMPDKELHALAKAGKLKDQMGAQISRMVEDPKAWNFVDNFTSQWLNLEKLKNSSKDVSLYPQFNRFVKADMRQETMYFVKEVLKEDLNINNFIDSSFTMLNQNLAQFYGIDGVEGSTFRKVPIQPEQRRGGLISQGSFLAGHASVDDSHPVKRGVWLIEKLLDDPPPPAPPNVPEIDTENPELARMSLKDQLKMHRDKDSCRDCHLQIDPWGVVMENYDAVGLLRDQVVKKDHKGKVFSLDVAAAAELENGKKLDGVDELKQYLLQERETDLRRSVTKHLVGYALGRSVSFTDEDVINDIMARTRQDGNGLRTLVEYIVTSDLFVNR